MLGASGESETHTMAQDHPIPPSEFAKPTRTDSQPQQASTQPGDGSKAHFETKPEADPVQQPQEVEGKIPWKDQVLGYAKVTRGTILGKQETKETGHKILRGEIVPEETRRHRKSTDEHTPRDD